MRTALSLPLAATAAPPPAELDHTLPAASRPAPRGGGLAAIDPARYVVHRELARGGMGRISVAEDTVLGRTVALKEVLSPDGPLAARFARELALTARLQHPSIVSVHDGGLWPSGELVYVMKLVKGASLDRVIARHATVAERVGLLPHGIAVCEAIAYAHAQGIIHRDLKPANVLVGDYGETVVIDWGLAKDLHDTTGSEPSAGPYRRDARGVETVDGDVMGTPAYMPPEQANGEPVDPSADVYALGALLYHVLAGVAPYTGRSAVDVLDAVLEGPPVPLDERAPGVPPDLVTIVGKAMARAPAERYATAGELAADLKRFQSGQLVGAHRYSTRQLVTRWARKHRTSVGVAVLATVALAVGGAISVERILQERQDADAARVLAESHRAVAEKNSDDAEGLTTFMLANLRDRLEAIGKQELLKEVAERVHGYYASQPEARGVAAQHGRSQARRNLGDVLLAQGNTDGAIAEYRAEQALLLGVLAQRPDAIVLRDLGVSHVKLARVFAVRGELAVATAASSAGTAILERIATSERTERAYREVSNAYDTEGDLLAAQGNLAAALPRFRTALDLAQRAATLAPDNTSTQRSISISHNKLGDMLLAVEDGAGALAEYRKSLDVIERLVARDASNTLWQRDLSVSYARLGDVLLPRGELGRALEVYVKARDIALALATSDPSNQDWQLDLAICHDNVADALHAQGALERALAELAAAMTIKRRQRAYDPANVMYARNLMVGHARIGNVLLDQELEARALEQFELSLAIATELAARHSGRDAREDLERARARIAKVKRAPKRRKA